MTSSSRTVGSLTQTMARLAPLETFDARAFVADGSVSQTLCNFVLALALAYNDVKDATMGYLLLREHKPAGDPAETPAWGTYGGLEMHFIRHHIGLVREICVLIEDNQPILHDPFLISTVSQMGKKKRVAWQALTNAAFNKPGTDALAKFLVIMRNKIVFHYDGAEIFSGYQQFFLRPTDPKEPYVSRGVDMEASRFYFADAAAQGYLDTRASDAPDAQLVQRVVEALRDVNVAVFELVKTFILRRNFAFRSVKTRGA